MTTPPSGEPADQRVPVTVPTGFLGSGKGPAGTAPRTLRCHKSATALAWPPGGNGQLASGGRYGAVALRHATAGRLESRLCPARTLDGGGARAGLLVSACRDGRIRAHRLPSRAAL